MFQNNTIEFGKSFFKSWRIVDDSGTFKKAVKCREFDRTTAWRLQLSILFEFFPDAEARKYGNQIGLETRVVHTLNHEYSILAFVWIIANALNTPPEHYDGNIEIQRN